MNTREKICVLYQVECGDGPELRKDASKRMHHFRQKMSQLPFRGQPHYYQLRVCSTWFTLYSLMLEMEGNEYRELMNLLEISIFSQTPSQETEIELLGIVGRFDLNGLPITSIQQCLTRSC